MTTPPAPPTAPASNGGWSVLVGASNEADLIAKSRDGDYTSFVSLLQLHDPPLRRVAYNCLGTAELMDNLLFDIYVDSYAEVQASNDDPPFGSWMLGRVISACEDVRSDLPGDFADDQLVDDTDDTDDARTAIALGLFEAPGDAVAALSLVAGEGCNTDQAALLLRTTKPDCQALLRTARLAVDLDTTKADELVAAHTPLRHEGDFWVRINRTFEPAVNPVDKASAKRAKRAKRANRAKSAKAEKVSTSTKAATDNIAAASDTSMDAGDDGAARRSRWRPRLSGS